MKKIMTAASAALLASTLGVFAQDSGKSGGAGSPEVKKMENGASGSSATGKTQPGSASDNSASDVAPGQVKEGTAANEVAPGHTKEGTAANEVAPGQIKDDGAASGSASTDTDASGKASKQKKADNPEAGTSGETTASINLTTEQQTEVRTVFREVRVEPVSIDFRVSIGVSAPETIVLHPLPARIIEVVPAYRTYKYFVLADGTIVIVAPETRRVVYVIAA